MTTPSTAPSSSMFTSKSFVVMLAACLSTVLLSWILSTQLFFGHGFIGFMGMTIGPLIVGLVVFGLLDPSEIDENSSIPAFFAMLIAIGIGAIIFATSTDSRMSVKVGAVNNALSHAAKLMGTPPAVAAEFAAATKDAKTAKANVAMVDEFYRATSEEQVVVNFLAAAKQFDLDASFVSSNGIVRKKDRQALYRRALDLSDQGNQQAASFIQGNQALAQR